NEVVNQQEILAQYPTIAQQGGTCPGIKVQMAYRGTEGDFALTLPGEQVYLLPMVPTIENLAAYWFKQMAEQSATLWLVQAYEGIGKGATIER
ncbi:MAG: hypothetical protein J6Y94_07870, partial [Bacteriovoracaceae bacterium]|nr:hypothetical protein [Bacteriovoracaceae bacterium]